MQTRRDFIKKAAFLSGGAGVLQALPASIQAALDIDPAPGSTWLDAEHIVVLMQENRSFDHCYGSLQGVRGFNDPRAIRLPNKDLVWLQTNAEGETYAPFHFDIRETRVTWLGSLPHSWPDQVDARNGGRYDQWLRAKASGHEGFTKAPLTMGYYSRRDLPFYYALADAFTVCDQNFCSSLTGTTPNRLYLWSGTIRAEQSKNPQANVSNSDVNYSKEVNWKTFPERLEENGISWKIYQNELSIETGLSSEEEDWLANFTDNPIEWFSQYGVRFHPAHYAYLEKMEKILPGEMAGLEKQLAAINEENEEKEKLRTTLKRKQELWEQVQQRHKWAKDNFDKLPQFQQAIHKRAFSTNTGDPQYRNLTTLRYKDGNTEREMQVPAGDILHQFREDVNNGKLPTVSWVIGPSNFSDHPGSPWYGAWYVSEVLDILTKNPEVWKKTIFILCYDENDGYFDHVPPFVPPHPSKKDTGLVSAGIDPSVEYVELEQDLKRTKEKYARESPIGLGYRVPLVVASPWSRGGAVCSQVFDHTSILMMMEKFLSHKTGKQILETNITDWRRTVCGDLSSVFRPYNGEKIVLPAPVDKESFYQDIHKAQFKKDPAGFRKLSAEEIRQINAGNTKDLLPKQEKGTRMACAIPYELYANGSPSPDKKLFNIKMKAGNQVFRKDSAGSAFQVYAWTKSGPQIRNYTVKAGDQLTDNWSMDLFDANGYHFNLIGPNGFTREYRGGHHEPGIAVELLYDFNDSMEKWKGDILLKIHSSAAKALQIEIWDNSYGQKKIVKTIGAKGSGREKLELKWSTTKSFGWYDLSILVNGVPGFHQRFTGHVETGAWTRTDPLMGN